MFDEAMSVKFNDSNPLRVITVMFNMERLPGNFSSNRCRHVLTTSFPFLNKAEPRFQSRSPLEYIYICFEPEEKYTKKRRQMRN